MLSRLVHAERLVLVNLFDLFLRVDDLPALCEQLIDQVNKMALKVFKSQIGYVQVHSRVLEIGFVP